MLENRNSAARPASLRRVVGTILCLTVFATALAVPSVSIAESSVVGARSDLDTSDISPAVDALFLRPLGMLTLLTGVALCVPATLMAAITRPTEISKPFRELIVEPARYVWVDPLGEH